jgi:hypothetical protein
MTYRTYSLALIVVGTALMVALWLGFERTRYGARIRAAVDNRRMAHLELAQLRAEALPRRRLCRQPELRVRPGLPLQR